MLPYEVGVKTASLMSAYKAPTSMFGKARDFLTFAKLRNAGRNTLGAGIRGARAITGEKPTMDGITSVGNRIWSGDSPAALAARDKILAKNPGMRRDSLAAAGLYGSAALGGLGYGAYRLMRDEESK